MNNLKKAVFAILTVAGNAAVAGTMGPGCVEGNVSVPCAHSAWDIGIQALYLQPTTSNDSFFSNYTSPAGITTWNGFEANWGWGYKLEGAYHFGTGDDININWYHFNNTTNGSFLSGPTNTPLILSTSLTPRWDAVNAEFGQLVHLGEFKNIRIYGGAQYAQIIPNFSSQQLSTGTEQLNIRYRGFGPRIGADLAYNWGHGFAMYANGATSLLVSGTKFNIITTGLIDDPGLSVGSKTSIVPELEGKLGAKYMYPMAQGDLSLDIGYLWQNYIHSIVVLSNNDNLTGSHDFGINGPYIGLKWFG